jgi:protein Tex
VSAMSRSYVSDPRSVVKPGDVVRVRVLSVDVPRQRISLTLRLDDDGPRGPGARPRAEDRSSSNNGPRTSRGSSPRSRTPASGAGDRRAKPQEGALADALRRAGLAPKSRDESPRRRS